MATLEPNRNQKWFWDRKPIANRVLRAMGTAGEVGFWYLKKIDFFFGGDTALRSTAHILLILLKHPLP